HEVVVDDLDGRRIGWRAAGVVDPHAGDIAHDDVVLDLRRHEAGGRSKDRDARTGIGDVVLVDQDVGVRDRDGDRSRVEEAEGRVAEQRAGDGESGDLRLEAREALQVCGRDRGV